MPELSFADVFSPEKETAIQILQQLDEVQKALKIANIFVIYWMKKMDMDNCVITKQEYLRLSESCSGVELGGSNDSVSFKIIEN